jgi:hypothetical protein
MATHFHSHFHPLLPLRRYAIGHPYAPEWTVVMVAAVAALLLWILNS